jgi:hypothetical protein
VTLSILRRPGFTQRSPLPFSVLLHQRGLTARPIKPANSIHPLAQAEGAPHGVEYGQLGQAD